jgi:predicted dehydrogenase
MARGQVNLGALTTRRVRFGDALGIYRDLADDGCTEVGVVLEYPKAEEQTSQPQLKQQNVAIPTPVARLKTPIAHLDVIGAGNFARTMLLPHLKASIVLGTVVNATALSANHVRSKFGFDSAKTDPNEVLGRQRAGAVLIATRHHLHAPLVKEALRADRHVFVEKPLCLTREELAEIDEALRYSRGSVMVGFNRRFAPATLELKRQLAAVPGPKSITFRVLPGKLDPQHWYANYAESGGRVLGEACHFFDYFCFVLGSRPVRVLAQTTSPVGGRTPFPDSVAAQVQFEDGSCAQLIYSAEGDSSFPKETFTLFGTGLVAEITNFRKLKMHHGRKERSFSYSSKGHVEEMEAWVNFLKGRSEHPLPYVEARRGMLLTFAALDSIRQAQSVDVPE